MTEKEGSKPRSLQCSWLTFPPPSWVVENQAKLDGCYERSSALWQEESGGNISSPCQHGSGDLKCEEAEDPDVGCQSSSQC